LLRSYDGLGRLGRVSFSRRTLFLWLRTPGGARFACSVTVTVLPRVEASASLAPTERGATLRIRVRNNAGQPCTGAARIAWAGGVVRSSANLKPRAEGVIGVALPSDTLALLSAGDNRFELALPGCAPIAVPVDASVVHEAVPALRSWMASRSEAVPLPEADLAEDTGWREWREWYAYGHWPWANSKPPLEAWAGKPEGAVPGLPEVRFAHSGRRLVPISWRIGRPSFTLNLQGRTYRKLYLLALPFLDNHDTFAPVARVTVRMEDGGVRDRVLSFPGDLDWWCPAEVVGSFATAPPSRTDRLGMCAAPEANGRWKAGLPPDYPQRELWATCRVVAGASAVMNVVEVDLGAPSPMHSVTLATIGSEPAIGLVAVTGEAASGHSALAGTSYDPPLGLREPVRVFGLNRAGDLEGWAVEGDAFSVAPAPGLFTKPTLNSIASHGESAIGRAVSPPFVLALSALRFRIHGGHSSSLTGDGALQVRLLDAASGEVLATMGPPGTHMVTTARFDVARWMGRRVRIELLDRNAAPSYAWIGISDVALSPR